MSNYKHLTREERYQIQAYRKAGFSQVEIAKELMVHKSTISRELKRNSSKVIKDIQLKKLIKFLVIDECMHQKNLIER